uniref:Bromo domain-containing protein n=1 Tax=Megaselia scalaris TaxID=36166 RepID=T1GWM6_MEGSC
MGSKKHKKHKSERRKKYSTDQNPSVLKLKILKVGNSATPEHGSDSYGIAGPPQPRNPFFFNDDDDEIGGGVIGEYSGSERKKLKKKKKKKDREKKHKHHKEKKHRHHEEESSQDETMFPDGEENSQPLPENMQYYANMTTSNNPCCRPQTKPIVPMKIESPSRVVATSIPSPGSTPGYSTPGSVLTPKLMENPKTPSSSSESGREPRSCVLKLKQSKSPLIKLLDHLLRALEKRDPHQFFAWPVTDDIAPGYSSIITKPMDFSTIRQKIDDSDLSQAAKKLLINGMKLLTPESLLRSLKPMAGYVRELTSKELGFELNHHAEHIDGFGVHHTVLDSADEGASTGAEELTASQLEEEARRHAIRLQNNPKSRFEPYVDDMTPEEILSQVQNAATAKRLTAQQKANKMGFLRQNKDGTTSMKILLRNENDGPERVVLLGEMVGKLKEGTGQLIGHREDPRNKAKMVKPLNYGSFSSFAPIFDSRFSNLSKEESELVRQTYGDEESADYAESIMEFTKDSSYASRLANGLLDLLTQGEHSKTISELYENQVQRAEVEEEYEKYKDVKIDFDNLKSLNDLGIDTTFVSAMEKEFKTYEVNKQMTDELKTNHSLLSKLYQTQYDRLSQSLPTHLQQVSQAGSDEHELALRITQNLTEIVKNVNPGDVVDIREVRKAMGMADVGLPPPIPPQLVIPEILQSNCQPDQHSFNISNNSQVGMDIDEELSNNHSVHVNHNNHDVDLESELREFLENGSNLGEADPSAANAIEQMLLN